MRNLIVKRSRNIKNWKKWKEAYVKMKTMIDPDELYSQLCAYTLESVKEATLKDLEARKNKTIMSKGRLKMSMTSSKRQNVSSLITPKRDSRAINPTSRGRWHHSTTRHCSITTTKSSWHVKQKDQCITEEDESAVFLRQAKRSRKSSRQN
jgi:hypothetical protein